MNQTLGVSTVLCVVAFCPGCSDDTKPIILDECRIARESCEAAGKCWRYSNEGVLQGELGYNFSNGSVSGEASGKASCNIECDVCSNDEVTDSAVEVHPATAIESALESAMGAWVRELCQMNFACDPIWMGFVTGDEAYCQSGLIGWMRFAASLPGSGVTVDSVRRCSDMLKSHGCDFSWSCAAGTRSIGEACADGWQCQSGWCNAEAFSCGACAAQPQATSLCSYDWQCPSNFFCSSGACAARGAEGQHCDDDNPCRPYHSCIANRCTKDNLSEGQACGDTRGYCDQQSAQLACNKKGVCEQVEFSSAGENCPDNGWCRGLGACYAGICRGAHELGNPCDSEGRCRWPDQCLDGTCRAAPSINPCQ